MDRRPTWTDCDEAGDYVVPNVLSPRDLVFKPDNMDETVPHTRHAFSLRGSIMIFSYMRKHRHRPAMRYPLSSGS